MTKHIRPPRSVRWEKCKPCGGFEMDDYWVWCGSPLRGMDGRMHLFASRWPKHLPFSPFWVTHSEIVRAEAPAPNGPYLFRETILPVRGEAFWDGCTTHNPAVVRWHGHNLLFYTGSHFAGEKPGHNKDQAQPDLGQKNVGQSGRIDPRFLEAHRNQRIGVAMAESPEGPWIRSDRPILEPRPGKWDALITTNPAPCVCSDGHILLVYKSLTAPGETMRLGIAASDRPEGPYQRLHDEPILDFSASGQHMEDPFLWEDSEGFHLLVKDMNGGLGGIKGGGVQFDSRDGIHWDPESRQPAYSRTLAGFDGPDLDFLERPQLLIEHGHPTHLFAAAALGGPDHACIRKSWNAVIPLSQP